VTNTLAYANSVLMITVKSRVVMVPVVNILKLFSSSLSVWTTKLDCPWKSYIVVSPEPTYLICVIPILVLFINVSQEPT
jgi:hypothetical protein